MKHKLILSFLAGAALLAGCAQEVEISSLAELKLESTYVTVPIEGTAVEVNLKATADWAFDKTANWPEWLTVTPESGSGDAVVKFSAPANEGETRSVEVKVKAGGKTQWVNVSQLGTPPVVVISTAAEVNGGVQGKTYYMTGAVTRIDNTLYGNLYVADNTGTVYIYGMLDKDGNTKNFSSLGIEVGDVVTVSGPLGQYNGNPQLVNASLVSIVKSLLSVNPSSLKLEKNDTTVTVALKVKGDGVNVTSDVPWISVAGINAKSDSTYVSLHVAANSDVKPRTGKVTFKSEKNGQVSEVFTNVTQKGNEPALSTVAEALALTYAHVQGQVVANSEKGYVLQDATGALFIYTNKYDSKIKIGENRKVIGKVGAYNYGPQIGTIDLDEWVSKGTYSYPSPAILDGPKMNEIVATLTGSSSVAKVLVHYVKSTGTVAVNGNYINILVDGESTLQISPYAALAADKATLTGLSGKKVNIYGYLTSVSTKKYFNIVITKIEEVI